MAIAARYEGYRYPIEVIGHAVWLYHGFALSLRDVEELMLARGVVVTHETIRSWCAKFGPDYAAQLRRRRPRPLGGVGGPVSGQRQRRLPLEGPLTPQVPHGHPHPRTAAGAACLLYTSPSPRD